MKKILVVLFGISFLLHLFFFSRTSYETMPNDVIEHTNYIKFVVNNERLPAPRECWVCYHPPLYYMAGASIYQVFEFFGESDEHTIFRTLQFLSVIQYFVILFVGIKIIARFIPRGFPFIAASALWLFWPSGYVHANRIGNDSTAFLFILISLLFLVKWWQALNYRDLILSVTTTAIGILIKTNAALMIPVIILSVGYKFLIEMSEKRLWLNRIILAFCIPVVAMVFNQRNAILGADQDDQFVGNIAPLLGSVYKVENTPAHLFGFDLSSYLVYSNVSVDNDEGGRQYFLNYLFKTAMFTELAPVNESQGSIAVLMSYLSLFLVAVMVVGVVRVWQTKDTTVIPLIAMLIVFWVGALYFRYKYSIANINDFRYIYPVLIPFIIFLFYSFYMVKRNFLLLIGFYTILLVFAVLSASYFLLPLV